MNSRSGIYREYEQNFLVDEQKLRKIVDLIKEQSKKLLYETYLEFYVEQAKDTFYHTQNIDEILQNDNTIEKSFCTIAIYLYRSDEEPETEQKPQGEKKPIISVAFTSERTPNLRFSVSSDNRDWTFLVFDELETQIKRTLTKKASKIFTPLFFDLLLATVIIISGLLLLNWLSLKYMPVVPSLDITIMTTEEKITKILELSIARNNSPVFPSILPLILSWILATIIVATRPFTKIIRKISKSYFLWGDMIQIHSKRETLLNAIKWGVVIAFIISILSGVVVALIMD